MLPILLSKKHYNNRIKNSKSNINKHLAKNMDDNKQYSKQYWKPTYIEFENILCYSKKKSFNFLDKSKTRLM